MWKLPSPTWPTMGAIRPAAAASSRAARIASARREIGTQTSVALASVPGRRALVAQ